MYAVAYRNTERNARPKPANDDRDVVVKVYYPREKRPISFREQMDRAWRDRQEREKRRIEAIDRAIREAKRAADARAAETYRTITVIPIAPEKVAVREVIEDVAARHGLTADQILGHRRSIPIVIARHEAICEAAMLRPDMSLPELGRQFKRDHTTILHALRKAGIPSSSVVRKHLDRET